MKKGVLHLTIDEAKAIEGALIFIAANHPQMNAAMMNYYSGLAIMVIQEISSTLEDKEETK